jgi:hypothetical protein
VRLYVGFLLLFTANMYTCTRLLIILLLFCSVGCRHKATVVDKGRPITAIKELNDLAGTWYATSDTYAMLKEKRYNLDSIYLELAQDSGFKAFHLPDCMTAANTNGMLKDAIGAWKLHQNGDAWKLSMKFEAGQLFRYKTFTEFNIVMLDSVLTIYQYIGDPNDGLLLRFIKARNP